MALLPSDVKLDSGLTKTLGDVGQAPMGSVQNVYSRLRSRAASDATARGQGPDATAPGSYLDNRLSTGQTLAEGNLRSGLEGVLGDEGYSDAKSQREFNQNMELAKMTGDIMKPSILEQVLGGLGAGANAAGSGYALYNSINRPKSTARAGGSSYSDLGYQPDYVG